jgi:hypothetical protein
VPLGDEEVDEETADCAGLHGGNIRESGVDSQESGLEIRGLGCLALDSRLLTADYLIDNLRDFAPGEATPSQICDNSAPLGLAGKCAQLRRAFPGQGQRHSSRVALLGPLGGYGPVDQTALNAHGKQVADQPSGTPAAGRSGLHIALDEGRIIQQAQTGCPVERRLDRLPLVPLTYHAPGKISPCIGTDLQGAQHRAIRGLGIGRAGEPLLESWIHYPTHRQSLDGGEIPGDCPEADAVDFQPDRIRASGVGLNGGNPEGAVHYLLVRLCACPDTDRSAHAEKLLDLSFDLGEEHRIVA